jgi:hypothetical protein
MHFLDKVNFKEFGFLDHNRVYFGNSLTFLQEQSLPSSGSKSEESKNQTKALHCSIFSVEE